MADNGTAKLSHYFYFVTNMVEYSLFYLFLHRFCRHKAPETKILGNWKFVYF